MSSQKKLVSTTSCLRVHKLINDVIMSGKSSFLGVLFVVSFFLVPQVFTVEASTIANTSTSTPVSIPTGYAGASVVKSLLTTFFKDSPAMVEIARCESEFRQFNDAGTVLRGGLGYGMVGVFQFNEAIHTKDALRLGFDLTTLPGNLGYAKHLYTVSGTQPWNSSKACWNTASKSVVSVADRAKLLAQIQLLLKQVALLQTQLAKL